jgi:hypothetical protein
MHLKVDMTSPLDFSLGLFQALLYMTWSSCALLTTEYILLYGICMVIHPDDRQMNVLGEGTTMASMT